MKVILAVKKIKPAAKAGFNIFSDGNSVLQKIR
jgi:hypothetical protein